MWLLCCSHLVGLFLGYERLFVFLVWREILKRRLDGILRWERFCLRRRFKSKTILYAPFYSNRLLNKVFYTLQYGIFQYDLEDSNLDIKRSIKFRIFWITNQIQTGSILSIRWNRRISQSPRKSNKSSRAGTSSYRSPMVIKTSRIWHVLFGDFGSIWSHCGLVSLSVVATVSVGGCGSSIGFSISIGSSAGAGSIIGSLCTGVSFALAWFFGSSSLFVFCFEGDECSETNSTTSSSSSLPERLIGK
jgi:hypothetical protein